MELVGVADLAPTLSIRALKEKGMPYDLYPVSYTHLDVYKRQPHLFRACKAAKMYYSGGLRKRNGGNIEAYFEKKRCFFVTVG